MPFETPACPSPDFQDCGIAPQEGFNKYAEPGKLVPCTQEEFAAGLKKYMEAGGPRCGPARSPASISPPLWVAFPLWISAKALKGRLQVDRLPKPGTR